MQHQEEEEQEVINVENTEVQTESMSIIDKAAAAAERIEKANIQLAALLERQEKMNVQKIMSGRSDAGIEPRVPTYDDKVTEYARNLLRGSGYENVLFSTK